MKFTTAADKMYRRSILTILAGMLMVFCGLSNGQEDMAEDMVIRTVMVTDAVSASQFFNDRNWIPSDGSASEIIDLASYFRLFQEWAGIPVTGELDQTTMDKMNSPKCGNPDFGTSGHQISARRKRFTTLGRTWPQNHLTWYLEGTTTDLSRNVIRSELAMAFQYWADVSSLTFEEVFTPNADILVNFYRLEHGDGNSFDGPGSVLAHAFSPGFGRGGDMHFDDDETFTASTGINLQQVAVHEIGHSLGLGHSSDQSAIMAAFYAYRQNFALGNDDIAGIQSLYGPPTSNPVTRPPVTQPRTTAPTTTAPTPPRTLPRISCNGEFDASVESFDGNVYFFQGDMVFKVQRDFTIAPGFPTQISAELPGAPDYIDAAFLWVVASNQKYLYVFKGNFYWRFFNGIPSAGYPRQISLWGIPGNIDGAFRWPGNRRIYFFKDDKYYRYNTMSYRIDNGYPQPLSRWNNVAHPISSVLDWEDNTYFFTGQYYQIFFNSQFSAASPAPTAQAWLGCETEGLRVGTTMSPTDDDDDDDNTGLSNVPSLFVIFVTSVLGTWLHISS